MVEQTRIDYMKFPVPQAGTKVEGLSTNELLALALCYSSPGATVEQKAQEIKAGANPFDGIVVPRTPNKYDYARGLEAVELASIKNGEVYPVLAEVVELPVGEADEDSEAADE